MDTLNKDTYREQEQPIVEHAAARLVRPTFTHANYKERGIEKSFNKRVVLLKRGII